MGSRASRRTGSAGGNSWRRFDALLPVGPAAGAGHPDPRAPAANPPWLTSPRGFMPPPVSDAATVGQLPTIRASPGVPAPKPRGTPSPASARVDSHAIARTSRPAVPAAAMPREVCSVTPGWHELSGRTLSDPHRPDRSYVVAQNARRKQVENARGTGDLVPSHRHRAPRQIDHPSRQGRRSAALSMPTPEEPPVSGGSAVAVDLCAAGNQFTTHAGRSQRC
jgi:hypothetical protein